MFYDLGEGRIRLQQFCAPGDVLQFSPVSVFEIVGKLNQRNFPRRRAAAQAILESTATQLPDPDVFLASCFGLELSEEPQDWMQALEALAQATSVRQLAGGVPDLKAGVIRALDLDKAHAFRAEAEKRWMNDLLTIMREEIPRFEDWYQQPASNRSGNKPRLKGMPKQTLLSNTKSIEWFAASLVACQKRAFARSRNRPSPDITQRLVEEAQKAIDYFACHCAVYTQYLLDLLTSTHLPQPNDRGDIDFFLYSTSDDHIVVTSERRWAELARRAGCAHRVMRLVPNSPILHMPVK